MKLLVIVPGFGPQNVQIKKNILKKNIDIIKKTYSGDIFLEVFNYGTESCDIDCDEIFGEGIVGQFLYKFITPDYIKSYNNIMILLDDIELSDNFNIDTIIKNLDFYQLDIISPILDKTSEYSHEHMINKQDFNENFNKIRITPFLELFCYIMNKNGYEKWYNLLDEKSCWLWGIDLSLYHKNIKCGLMEGVTMHHYFKGGSYTKNLPSPQKEMAYYNKIKKYKYINLAEIQNLYEYVDFIN